LPLPQLEERLESIIRARGEESLNAIRDRAKEIAQDLGMSKEFRKLNNLISNLLATGRSKNLKSPAGIARALGEPLDPDRIRLFESLYEELAGQVFPEHKDKNTTDKSHKTCIFRRILFELHRRDRIHSERSKGNYYQ
jgi:hypothetical protein